MHHKPIEREIAVLDSYNKQYKKYVGKTHTEEKRETAECAESLNVNLREKLLLFTAHYYL